MLEPSAIKTHLYRKNSVEQVNLEFQFAFLYDVKYNVHVSKLR